MSLSGNAGSSTPSRKRSKWQDQEGEEEEEEDPSLTQLRIQLKRRVRPKRSLERSHPSTPASPTTTQLLLTSTSVRTSHSVYVPPRTDHPPILPSRSVYSYERLNQIEEGSYGVVFRARDKGTGDIVALKKLKLDEEKNGFPITALREINALMSCRHENVVGVREVVVGDTLTQVFVVMDFIEHDLKSLLTLMPSPFLQSEVKTLMLQLLSAVKHCHSNWILHRDLKTSNLLMNNRGTMKVADFGLARRYGDPVGVGGMTQLVVTLWYRAPEILLGAETYSTAVDMWSVGCIFAELLLKEPLFQAKGELELISMIFKLLGAPTNSSWPGYSTLPLAKTITLPSSQPPQFRQKFQYLTPAGLDLMMSLLTYDPERRISAEEALQHPYFSESPLPKHPDLFGSFPSAAAGEKCVSFTLIFLIKHKFIYSRKRKVFDSPSAPVRAADYKLLTEFDIP
ncbi:Pkinase-domain-containing protein [Marasmius fiardii PR-910]|nr:Pkinase-domain-containing protein [Marasmius fiardii PR-910]